LEEGALPVVKEVLEDLKEDSEVLNVQVVDMLIGDMINIDDIAGEFKVENMYEDKGEQFVDAFVNGRTRVYKKAKCKKVNKVALTQEEVLEDDLPSIASKLVSENWDGTDEMAKSILEPTVAGTGLIKMYTQYKDKVNALVKNLKEASKRTADGKYDWEGLVSDLSDSIFNFIHNHTKNLMDDSPVAFKKLSDTEIEVYLGLISISNDGYAQDTFEPLSKYLTLEKGVEPIFNDVEMLVKQNKTADNIPQKPTSQPPSGQKYVWNEQSKVWELHPVSDTQTVEIKTSETKVAGKAYGELKRMNEYSEEERKQYGDIAEKVSDVYFEICRNLGIETKPTGRRAEIVEKQIDAEIEGNIPAPVYLWLEDDNYHFLNNILCKLDKFTPSMKDEYMEERTSGNKFAFKIKAQGKSGMRQTFCKTVEDMNNIVNGLEKSGIKYEVINLLIGRKATKKTAEEKYDYAFVIKDKKLTKDIPMLDGVNAYLDFDPTTKVSTIYAKRDAKGKVLAESIENWLIANDIKFKMYDMNDDRNKEASMKKTALQVGDSYTLKNEDGTTSDISIENIVINELSNDTVIRTMVGGVENIFTMSKFMGLVEDGKILKNEVPVTNEVPMEPVKEEVKENVDGKGVNEVGKEEVESAKMVDRTVNDEGDLDGDNGEPKVGNKKATVKKANIEGWTKADMGDLNGTHHLGAFEMPYAEVVAKFGEPNAENDGYKTDAEWNFKTPAGVLTIYNYKTGPNYNNGEGTVEEIREWNIGGNDKAVVEEFKKVTGLTVTAHKVEKQASAFDKVEKIDIAEGLFATKNKETNEIEAKDLDGNVICSLPDAFGDEIVPIVKVVGDYVALVKKCKDTDVKVEEAKESAVKEIELQKKASIDTNKQLKEAMNKIASFEMTAEIVKKTAACASISEAAFRKGLLDIDDEAYAKAKKSGKSLIEAKEEAIRATINKQVKSLMAMGDRQIEEYSKSVERISARLTPLEKEFKLTRGGFFANGELPEDEDEFETFKKASARSGLWK
jgi:hypothetical protein